MVIDIIKSMVSIETDISSIFMCFVAVVALLCVIPGVLYKPLELQKEQLDQVSIKLFFIRKIIKSIVGDEDRSRLRGESIS